MIDLIGRLARMIDPAAEWARVTADDDKCVEHDWLWSYDCNFRVCNRCEECGWFV